MESVPDGVRLSAPPPEPMSVQEIERAIPALGAEALRRLQALVEAQLRLEAEADEPVPYERIAHLAGVFGDAPADLSSNKRYLEGLGQRSVG